jgi:hypothetical protein
MTIEKFKKLIHTDKEISELLKASKEDSSDSLITYLLDTDPSPEQIAKSIRSAFRSDIKSTDRINPKEITIIEGQIAEYLKENNKQFEDIFDSSLSPVIELLTKLIYNFRVGEYQTCAIILNREL